MIKFYIGGLYPRTPFFPNGTDSLFKLLLRSGFTNTENLEEAEVYISADMHEKDVRNLSKIRSSCSSFLLRYEPRIVCPLNYEEKVIERLDTIIDGGRLNQKADIRFNFPQFWPENIPENFENRLDRIAIIAGNKLTFIPGELYSLRRLCILKFEKIDHYGASWNLSKFQKSLELLRALRLSLRYKILPKLSAVKYWFKTYPKWLGSPFDKRQCLAGYKYSLVIENSAEYLSEKLFDAFFSLVIPIYVGPDILEFGIPSHLVIQCEPNLDSIEDGIRRAYETDYIAWCDAVIEWLASPKTRSDWDGYLINGRIIDEIKKRVNKVN